MDFRGIWFVGPDSGTSDSRPQGGGGAASGYESPEGPQESMVERSVHDETYL